MTRPRPGAAETSDRLRRASERELERLTRDRGRLETKAEPLRRKLAEIDGQISQIDALAGLLLQLTGGERHAREHTTGPALRGAAFAEAAIKVLRAADRGRDTGGIHYRDWYGLCVEAGVLAGGRNPVATFLTTVRRSPMVRVAVGAAPGHYQIDTEAPARLTAQLGPLQLELQQALRLQKDLREAVAVQGRSEKLAEARERHDKVMRKITRVEKELRACARAFDPTRPQTDTSAAVGRVAEPPAAVNAATSVATSSSSQQTQGTRAAEGATRKAPRAADGAPAAAAATPEANTAQATPPARAPMPLELVLYEVGRRFAVTTSQMLGSDPEANTARQVAMNLARTVLGMSYADVGSAFGRDEQAARVACEMTAGFMLDDLGEVLREALGFAPVLPVRKALRPTPALRVAIIIDAVAGHFGTTRDGLLARGRKEPTATARLIAMRLACEFTDLSYPQVGRQFGRDHSTMISAWDSAASLPILSEVRQKVREAIAAAEGDAPDLEETTALYQDDSGPGDETGAVGVKPRQRRRAHPAATRRRRGSQ